jgi:hypothetical protein
LLFIFINERQEIVQSTGTNIFAKEYLWLLVLILANLKNWLKKFCFSSDPGPVWAKMLNADPDWQPSDFWTLCDLLLKTETTSLD